MNGKKAKKARRATIKRVNEFLDNLWRLRFRDRLKIAWRIIRKA